MTLIRSGDGEVRRLSVPLWLVQLLTRKPLRGAKLKPEDIIAISLADKLRIWTLEGRLKGVWSHLPHEVGGRGVSAKIRMGVAKAMGLVPGSADYVFTWGTGSGWIELKTETGSLSVTQRLFRDWCQREGVNWACCRSSDAAEAKLIEWGALDAAR